MLRGVLATTVIAAAVMFAGCESTDEAASQPDDSSMGMINSTCPISGHDVNPDSTVSYKGATVGLCCDDCLGAWNKKSNADKSEYIASASD